MSSSDNSTSKTPSAAADDATLTSEPASSSCSSRRHGDTFEEKKAMKRLVLGIMGCHCGIECDACHVNNFFGYRYKCAVCPHFDLCSNCFEDRVEIGQHKKKHPLKVVRTPDIFSRYSDLFGKGLDFIQQVLIHKHVTHESSCRSCDNSQPITGLAFVCDDCRGYRMCYDCYESGKTCQNHEDDHCLLVEVFPREFRVETSSLKFGKLLGGGSFGDVYAGKKDGENVALKVCKTQKGTLQNLTVDEQKMLLNEIRIYQEFFCDYIVEFHGFDVSNDRIVMVLELFTKGNLEDHINSDCYKNESKRRRLYYCENIIRGLFRMHKKGIIHKDLKPDNIFLSKHNTVKIGDMGIAFNPDNSDQCLKYIRQQLYYPKQSKNVSHPTYDIHAFGLLFNEIMTGVRNVQLTPHDCLDRSKVPYFGKVIAACISVQARDRPTTQSVRDYISRFHKFLSNYIDEKDLKYESRSLHSRNSIFDDAYLQFVAENEFTIETDNTYTARQIQGDEIAELLLRILAQQGMQPELFPAPAPQTDTLEYGGVRIEGFNKNEGTGGGESSSGTPSGRSRDSGCSTSSSLSTQPQPRDASATVVPRKAESESRTSLVGAKKKQCPIL